MRRGCEDSAGSQPCYVVTHGVSPYGSECTALLMLYYSLRVLRMMKTASIYATNNKNYTK